MIEGRVVTQQRVGDNSLTPSGRVGVPTRRVGDTGSSSAVRFGGSTSTVAVETSRRAGEEEFSRRTGFGEERVEEVASGEDWGEVSSSEEEGHHHEHDGDEGEDGRKRKGKVDNLAQSDSVNEYVIKDEWSKHGSTRMKCEIFSSKRS